MTLSQAIRAVRKHSGKTQQVFATELGMSIRALFSYEQGKMPEPKQLAAFARAAEQMECWDLAAVFSKELKEALGIEYMHWVGPGPRLPNINPDDPEQWYERQAFEALFACLVADDLYADLAPQVISALALVVERRANLEYDSGIFTRFAEESVRRRYVPKVHNKVIWETTIKRRKGNRLVDLIGEPAVRRKKSKQ